VKAYILQYWLQGRINLSGRVCTVLLGPPQLFYRKKTMSLFSRRCCNSNLYIYTLSHSSMTIFSRLFVVGDPM